MKKPLKLKEFLSKLSQKREGRLNKGAVPPIKPNSTPSSDKGTGGNSAPMPKTDIAKEPKMPKAPQAPAPGPKKMNSGF